MRLVTHTTDDTTTGRAALWAWMQRREVNQREAADILGIDFTMLNHYLSGRRSPALATAVLIERKTGIPVEAWVPTADGAPAQPVGAGRKSRK